MKAKLALAALAMALAGHLAIELGRPPPEPPVPPPARLQPLPPPPTLDMPALDRFTEMVARPPFSPDRRPADGGGNGGGTAGPPQARLVGVVLSGTTRLALIVNGGGPPRRLEVGQILDGWTIAAIEPDRVVLRRDRQDQALLLVKPKRPSRPRQGS